MQINSTTNNAHLVETFSDFNQNQSEDLSFVVSQLVETQDSKSIERSKFLLCSSELDKQVIKKLYSLGMSPALKGFRYLKLAIKMGLIDIQNIDLITKFTYPKIARVFGTNSKAVERSIRTCIKTLGGDIATYSNKRFIFMIIYQLNIEEVVE